MAGYEILNRRNDCSMLIQSMVKRFSIVPLLFAAASAAIAQSLPEMRMTPAEIRATTLDNNRIGSGIGAAQTSRFSKSAAFL